MVTQVESSQGKRFVDCSGTSLTEGLHLVFSGFGSGVAVTRSLASALGFCGSRVEQSVLVEAYGAVEDWLVWSLLGWFGREVFTFEDEEAFVIVAIFCSFLCGICICRKGLEPRSSTGTKCFPIVLFSSGSAAERCAVYLCSRSRRDPLVLMKMKIG